MLSCCLKLFIGNCNRENLRYSHCFCQEPITSFMYTWTTAESKAVDVSVVAPHP